MTTCSTTVDAVYTTVSHSEFQKRGSSSILPKLSSPTKPDSHGMLRSMRFRPVQAR